VHKAHWSLNVINITQKTICHYDCLENPDISYSRSCLRYLQDGFFDKFEAPVHNMDEWNILQNVNRIPHQANNFDCGIFVYLFAGHLLNNKPLNFNLIDIDRGTRMWIVKAILQIYIPNTDEGYCYTLS